MELFPAIDLIDGCAVRLVKGDYAQKTIYSENPAAVARSFAAAGAKYLHVVDLEGAKNGGTPNLETIRTIVRESGLLVEVGGHGNTLNEAKNAIALFADSLIQVLK